MTTDKEHADHFRRELEKGRPALVEANDRAARGCAGAELLALIPGAARHQAAMARAIELLDPPSHVHTSACAFNSLELEERRAELQAWRAKGEHAIQLIENEEYRAALKLLKDELLKDEPLAGPALDPKWYCKHEEQLSRAHAELEALRAKVARIEELCESGWFGTVGIGLDGAPNPVLRNLRVEQVLEALGDRRP